MKKPNMTDVAKFDHVKTILSTAEKLGAKITNTYDRDPNYEYNGRKRKAFRIRMGRKTGGEIATAIADELGITVDKLHNWVSDIGVYGDYIMVYDDNDMNARRKFTRDAFHKDDKWEPSDDWHSSDEWNDKGGLNENTKVTLTFGQLKRLVKEEFDYDDAWDCPELRRSGLMRILQECRQAEYLLENCTRDSADWGNTLGDLKAYINELADEMKEAANSLPDEG